MTVIATGFDSDANGDVLKPDFRRAGGPAPRPASRPQTQSHQRPVSQPRAEAQPVQQPRVQMEESLYEQKQVAIGGGGSIPVQPPVTPLSRMPSRPVSAKTIGELDIPTFIRRQMD